MRAPRSPPDPCASTLGVLTTRSPRCQDKETVDTPAGRPRTSHTCTLKTNLLSVFPMRRIARIVAGVRERCCRVARCGLPAVPYGSNDAYASAVAGLPAALPANHRERGAESSGRYEYLDDQSLRLSAVFTRESGPVIPSEPPMRIRTSLLPVLLARAAAFSLPGSPPSPNRTPGAAAPFSSGARSRVPVPECFAEEDLPEPEEGAECLTDEPVAECIVRSQLDGPWNDVWARYVLLRPGMSYSELKEATLRRNKLSPTDRIPGTYRTVVLAHAICFIAAIPAVLTSDEVFPKLLGVATASRVASGIP